MACRAAVKRCLMDDCVWREREWKSVAECKADWANDGREEERRSRVLYGGLCWRDEVFGVDTAEDEVDDDGEEEEEVAEDRADGSDEMESDEGDVAEGERSDESGECSFDCNEMEFGGGVCEEAGSDCKEEFIEQVEEEEEGNGEDKSCGIEVCDGECICGETAVFACSVDVLGKVEVVSG